MTGVGVTIVAVAVAIGLVGILVPVLPGLVLVAAAVTTWGIVEGGAVGWAVAGVAVLLAVGGTAAKLAIPGRRLRRIGIPASTLAVAALLALVGFFVVPVIGAVVGFIGGVYVLERHRLGEAAWNSTVASVRAVALAIAIEFTAGLLIAAAWGGALFLA
jgi:uncharacterized protein YqgC (DUF456 family)